MVAAATCKAFGESRIVSLAGTSGDSDGDRSEEGKGREAWFRVARTRKPNAERELATLLQVLNSPWYSSHRHVDKLRLPIIERARPPSLAG